MLKNNKTYFYIKPIARKSSLSIFMKNKVLMLIVCLISVLNFFCAGTSGHDSFIDTDAAGLYVNNDFVYLVNGKSKEMLKVFEIE